MVSSLYLSILGKAKIALVTEYEELLMRMIEERRAKLKDLKDANDEKIKSIQSEIRFLEVELQRYQQSMALFRQKPPPKVGRWGKPGVEEGHESK